jgi:MFS family permease
VASKLGGGLLFLDASVFMSSLGLGITSYFIPNYVQTIGGSMQDVGWVGSARSIPYAFLPFLLGRFSDRGKRKQLYLLSIFVNLASTLCLLAASSVQLVILTQLLASVGFSLLWPITEAMVAESVDDDRRVSSMGWYSVSWVLGFLLGPAIGGPILDRGGYLWLFGASSLVLVATAAFTAMTIGRSYRPRPLPSKPGLGLPSLKLSPAYMAVVAYGIAFSVIVALFPAYLKDLGYNSTLIGDLFALFGVARLVAFMAVDRFSKALPRTSLYVSAVLMLAGLSFVGVFNLTTLAPLAALLIVSGFGFATFYPVLLVLVSNRSTKEELGAAVGAMEAFYGIGVVAGPLIGGYISAASPVAPYLLSCVVSLIIPALLAAQYKLLRS